MIRATADALHGVFPQLNWIDPNTGSSPTFCHHAGTGEDLLKAQALALAAIGSLSECGRDPARMHPTMAAAARSPGTH